MCQAEQKRPSNREDLNEIVASRRLALAIERDTVERARLAIGNRRRIVMDPFDRTHASKILQLSGFSFRANATFRIASPSQFFVAASAKAAMISLRRLSPSGRTRHAFASVQIVPSRRP
jgi:hypothetical protein